MILTKVSQNNYMFKFNNRTTRKSFDINSELTTKTPKSRYSLCFGVFIVELEHISYFFSTVLFIIFENFTKFEYSFHSLKVKLSLTNFIYELPHELPNEFVPSLLKLALKKYVKSDIKVFRFCLTLLGFLIFLKIVCTGL